MFSLIYKDLAHQNTSNSESRANRQTVADNNEMAAVLINNEATLKRFCKTEYGVELRPSNPLIGPTAIRSGDVNILGVVVGLFRKY